MAVLGLALLARLPGLFTRSIWYDEALSLLYAQATPAEIIYSITGAGSQAANVHPPTYFIALSFWQSWLGDTIESARLFSILASVLTAGLVYLIARDLFQEASIALYAGVFTALSPYQVHYGQEIRMYAWMAFFLVAATYALLRAVRSDRFLWWAVFSLTSALAQYSQSLSAFYLLPLAASVLFTRNRKTMLNTFLAGLAAMLLYLPWLANLPAQLGKIQAGYWVEAPGLPQVFTLLLTFITNLPLPGAFLPVGLFVTLMVLALTVTLSLPQLSQRTPDSLRIGWLAYLTLLPPALAFLVSQWIPIYVERAFLASGAILMVWLAWVVARPQLARPLRAGLAGMLLIGFGIGYFQHLAYQGFPYGPYRELAAHLLEFQSQPDGRIIHSNKLSLVPVHYYNGSLEQVFIADPPGSSTDTLAAETRQVIGVQAAGDIESAAGESQTIIFIIFAQSIQEAQTAGLPTHPHLTWLEEHYSLSDSQAWGDLLRLVYEK